MIIDFQGEFGYELISAVPYAYYLHLNNKLTRTISCLDTKSLYYFSNHEERYDKRISGGVLQFPICNIHKSELDKSQWNPPPYKDKFKNNIFIYDKPICVISNKYTMEWEHDPVNFLNIETIKSIIEKLKDKYQIIYNRPENIVFDDIDLLFFNDKEEIKKIDGVILIENIMKEHNYTINELQMMIFANCDKFISVQGGNSILSSYFGGENHIYAVKGGEIDCNSFNNWYHEFSGCKVYVYNDYEKLIESL
jgi:hypothetical protein